MKDASPRTRRSPVPSPVSRAVDGPETTAPLRVDWPRLLAWLPIPLLLAVIAGLWVADLRTPYESRSLMVLLNVFFTWLASLCICFLTARGFLGSGQPGLLMFGCGSLLWGVTSLAAAVIVDRVNPTITVHNLYYWYGLGLALVATGLTGVMLLTVQGGILGWTNRLTQYLGSAYLFIAALMAARESGTWTFSLSAVDEALQKHWFMAEDRRQQPLRQVLRYSLAIVAVAAGWGLRKALEAWVGPGLPTYVTFYPAVMAVALVAGFGPGLLATALAGMTVVYWALPPIGQFSIASPVDRVGLLVFTGMGLFMSVVAELYQRKRDKAAAYDREAALRETRREKEFLAGLLEHASQPFAVGYPDGRLGRVNLAYEQLTGYTAAELHSLDWSKTLTPPEWRELERRKLDELLRAGQPVRYEKEYIRKDGSRVPIELLVHAMHDTAGELEYYYSFIADITERKRAQVAMRENEERLRFALETIHTGAWYLNLVDHTAFRSLEHDRIFGYANLLPEWTYEMFLEHVLPEDRAAVDGRFRQAMESRSDWNFECRIRRTDGAIRWIWAAGRHHPDTAGIPCRMAGIVQDITDRKAAEVAIWESEQRYRAIGESIDYGVWVCDPEGRNVYASDSFLKLVGITQQQCSEFGWGDVLHPDDAEHTIAAWKECVRTGGTWDIEHRFRGVDGQWHPILARGVPVRDEEGRITCWAGINLDITVRKRAEEALRKSEQEFRALAEAVPQIVWATRPDGWNIYFNQQWVDYTGLTLDESYGHGWKTPFPTPMTSSVPGMPGSTRRKITNPACWNAVCGAPTASIAGG